MSYLEWGDASNPEVLVCVHGLSRNAHDFDPLAKALAGEYRVVCPDVAGRGESDRLADPMLYGPVQYAADMLVLLARLGVERVHWVGTSMGGLIGMLLAADPKSPLRSLILNDIGPVVSKAGLERIGDYVGRDPHFATMDDAERYVREVMAGFGTHDDAQWRWMTEISVKPDPAGGYRLAYDPAIAEPIRRSPPTADLQLWAWWDAIRCPSLVLRGASSDLLSRETADAMRQRGPRASVAEFEGAGHAPTFLRDDTIVAVRAFLRNQPPA